MNGFTVTKTKPGHVGHIPTHHVRVPGAPGHLHVGPIHSVVSGRTDHLPAHVPSGSYVLPADFVSHMGQSNTTAGFKVLRRVFGGTPYGQGSSPYGQAGGPYGEPLASGGYAGTGDTGVPVVLAGGEYVLTPEEVTSAGNGDLDTGHRVLDEWVLRVRNEQIKTLQGLPGPAKS